MTTCPNCGTPATTDDVFCSGCGQRLTQPAGSPPSGQPPLPPMPGPPPPSGGSSDAYTPPPQQVVQPAYQQPVTPSYAQTPPQKPSVVQPAYGQGGSGYAAPQPAAPPKKKKRGCLIAIIVAVVLAICAVVIVAGAAVLPEILDQINPDTPYTSGGTTGGNSVPIDVVNNLSYDVCYLYISSASSEDWGYDWLGDSGIIEPGTTMTFYLTSGETVDIQAEDCNGGIIDNQYNVLVPDDGLTYTLNP